MSNIFAPLVRPFGGLPVETGSGPVPGDAVEYMHMLVSQDGELYTSNDAIHHYGAALPFDVNGRVVISPAEVSEWDQGIPFTASGAVAMGSDVGALRWDQGLTFLESGHIATGDVAPPITAPIWSELPDQFHYLYELPQDYDVSPYVTSGGDPITGYSLVTPPAGFSIDANGVITAAVGAADGDHVVTVRATNGIGSSDQSFTWSLDTGNVPTWTTIPEQSHRENDLPKTLDVQPYATSDSGEILGYTLTSPPPGFSISGSVITASAGTVVAAHALTVNAINGVGVGSTSFTWNILEELVKPVWQTIPNQSNQESDLPQNLNAALYVSSNSGPLVNWRLITPPSGFSISATGVITAAAGTALAVHNIVVGVSNDQGESTTSFTWTISDTLLPPDWSTVPPQTTREDALPALLDMNTFVSSNSGTLTGWTINPAVTGYSINASGILTVAAGTAVGVSSVTVEVTNDTGTTASDPFNWEITLFYVSPVWSTIPNQSDFDADLPGTLDVTPYVTTNAGPLTGWSLVTPPGGFTIDAAGTITCAPGTALGDHSITVRVSNDEGTADSAPFTWSIADTPEPPVWQELPDQSTREDNLPASLDVSAYVTSNSGPLRNWELLAPPAGFSISNSGLISVQAGLTPATYPLTVRVENDEGTADSNTFDWGIVSFYLPPQWATIPDQSTEEQLLPVVLDVKPYVTSNHGTLTGWALVSPPAGWTIAANGVITVAASRPVGSNSITVRVSNDSGSADSLAFNWDILEEPIPPQWTQIPDQQTREDSLPVTLDANSYVSTNSGVLHSWQLISPPAGFTISGAGVITVGAGTTVAIHSLSVRVSNDEGSSDSAEFTWEVQEELLNPQWDTVPDKSDRINILPQNYDMQFYVSSNAGALVLWRLASAPAGFTINSSGIITASAGTAVDTYTLRVGVTNSVGESLSNSFTWDILEELKVPQWDTIPDRDDAEDTLPQGYDVSGYVTSNSGPLTGWTLVTPPAGFTISGSGVVTAASGASAESHTITVRVSNDTGPGTTSFTWTINEVAADEYFHEFNATLGAFGLTRAGDFTELDNTGEPRTVSTNQPAYLGCSWTGSAFAPNAGFVGLSCDGAGTNYLRNNRRLDLSTWSKTNGNITNQIEFNPTSSNAGVFESMSRSGQHCLSADLTELSNLSGNTILIRTTSGSGDTVVPTGTKARYDMTSSSSFTGVGVAQTGSGGKLEADLLQLEPDWHTPSSRILSGSSTTSRAAQYVSAGITDFGFDAGDWNDGFSLQVKARIMQPNASGEYLQGDELSLVSLSGTTADTNWFFSVAITVFGSNPRIRFLTRNNGTSNFAEISGSLSQYADVDIRARFEPGAQPKLWLTGDGYDTTALGPSNSQTVPGSSPIDQCRIGYLYDPGTNGDTGQGYCVIKQVRIDRRALSDAAIEAWT